MKRRSRLTVTSLGFQKTLLNKTESVHRLKGKSDPAKFDLILDGGDTRALSDSQISVYEQFPTCYSQLKRNNCPNPDIECISTRNSKIKNIIGEFVDSNDILERLNMSDSEEPPTDTDEMPETEGTPAVDTDDTERGQTGTDEPTPKPAEGAPHPSPTPPSSPAPPTSPLRVKSPTLPAPTTPPPPPPSPATTPAAVVATPPTPDTGLQLTDQLKAGNFPIKDDDVLRELADADERAKKTAALIESMRAGIAEYSKKQSMSEEDAMEMQTKQNELMEKLSEFEAVTKHIQELLGVQQSGSTLGLPLQCEDYGEPKRLSCGAGKEYPEDKLPKVIICGTGPVCDVPKIIVCEAICKEGEQPLYQQYQGRATGPGVYGPCPTDNVCEQMIREKRRSVCSDKVGGMERISRGQMGGPQMPGTPRMIAPTGMDFLGGPMPMEEMGGFPVMSRPEPRRGSGRGGMGGAPGGMGGMGGAPGGMGGAPGGMGGAPGGAGGMGGAPGGMGGAPGGMGGMRGAPGGMGGASGGMGGASGGMGGAPGGMGGAPGGMGGMGGAPGGMGGMGGAPGGMGGMGGAPGGMGGMGGAPGNMRGMGGGAGGMGGMGGAPGGMGGMRGAPGGMGSMGENPECLGGMGGAAGGFGGAGGMGGAPGGMGGMGGAPGGFGGAGGMGGSPGGMGGAPGGFGGAEGMGGAPGGFGGAGGMGGAPGGMGGAPGRGSIGNSGMGNMGGPLSGLMGPMGMVGPGMNSLGGPPGLMNMLGLGSPGMMGLPGMGMGPCCPCSPEMNREKVPFSRPSSSESHKRMERSQPAEEQTVEGLQKQMDKLKNDLKCVCDENNQLKKQLNWGQGGRPGGKPMPGKPLCKMQLASGVPTCKLDLYRQMGLPLPGLCASYGDGPPPTEDMETMIASMEDEVRSIQKELEAVQAERRSLELQKKLLKCAAPTIAGGGGGGVGVATQIKGGPLPVSGAPSSPLLSPIGPPGSGKTPTCVLQLQQQLKELREQYNKLQKDYNDKVEEVSILRVDLDSTKRESIASIEKSDEAEARVDDLLERLRVVENEKLKIAGSKDQMMELEQQLILAKQRYRESVEELDECKTQVSEMGMQLDEYRRKYLNAQQLVEEQRRQIDIMEMENRRFGEQLALEMQRAKSQFQAKLEELTPLPEMLKTIQQKLMESQKLRSLAERTCEQLGRDLEVSNEEKEKLVKKLEEIDRTNSMTEAEKASLQTNLTDGEKKMEETKAENVKLKATLARLEELALSHERRYEEKVHESLQLQTQLETLREESARQVSRTKDRLDTMRRSLQGQISELERQLAASRAAARTAEKDRDEIRQKMQAQITHLNENFEQAQMRIRSLQSHVNYLKTSYTNIFAPDTEMVRPAMPLDTKPFCD